MTRDSFDQRFPTILQIMDVCIECRERRLGRAKWGAKRTEKQNLATMAHSKPSKFGDLQNLGEILGIFKVPPVFYYYEINSEKLL